MTLVEVARLRIELRHGADRRGKYSIIAALINLRDIAPPPVLDMVLPNGFGTRHAPIYWNVAGDSAEETLIAIANGSTSWGMLFWLPLMRGGEVTAHIERWKELVRMVPNRKSQSDLARIVIVFAELAGNYVAWQKALEGWDMTESPVVNSWIAAADQNARLEQGRASLLKVLRTRFPQSVPLEVETTIQNQPSLSLLDDWIGTAATAQSMEAFIAVLRR